MPRGYRCIILAAFGWLILAAAVQQADQNNSTKATTPSEQARPPYAPYPNLSADACYKAKDHDQADLCAQWRAAFAAEKAANAAQRAVTWTIWSTVLSALALGALLYALSQTEKSLAEARRGNILAMRENARATRRAIAGAKETADALSHARASAEATSMLANVSRETAERQLRAYVGAENVFAQNISPGGNVTAFVHPKNSGQTPAYGFRGITLLKIHSGDPHTMPIRFGGNPTSRTDLGRGEDVNFDNDLGGPLLNGQPLTR